MRLLGRSGAQLPADPGWKPVLSEKAKWIQVRVAHSNDLNTIRKNKDDYLRQLDSNLWKGVAQCTPIHHDHDVYT